MKLNYNWTLKDAVFTKDKGKVFSCFACGGGSTMGYKLAGFDVIGCNEIDPKMIEAYRANHNPKYSFLEPIQTFKDRDDLPSELFNLDILDGSPPCSSFSVSGNREDDWGKEKKFKEGQAKQVLDTLFFDFIDLAKKLQPKVIVAENVKGLLLGEAKEYVRKIYKELENAGYYVQHWLLDASTMGVPQRRERVFFIALRKDLASKFLYQADMFTVLPRLNLNFKEKQIFYSEIETIEKGLEVPKKIKDVFFEINAGECLGDFFERTINKRTHFNYNKAHIKQVLPTITANLNSGTFHYSKPYFLSTKELLLAGSYPLDYNFLQLKPKYLVGMSVPPLMVARIANEIFNQWLSKL
jgi:DNA (cytosine-5)-methyltransferase 1